MDLGKVIAFHQLVMEKTEQEKIELAKQFDIDYSEYQSRILGKEKEAEFLIIMISLGVLKHLEAYDEGLSHITNEYTPDFKIEMSDGYKMLLEIKHTEKEVYKISQGNLQKRIDFANRQGIPLRFAISIRGFWGLFTAETLQEKKGKLTIEDFGGKNACSWLDVELATCSYMFPQKIRIESIYSKNHTKGMGIYFEPYGELVSYRLYSDDKLVFKAKGKESRFLPHTIILEALQDRAANAMQTIETQGEVTIITECLEGDKVSFFQECQFLLAYIKHMSKDLDNKRIPYDYQIAISERDFSFLTVQSFRFFLSELVDLGLVIMVFRGNMGYRFKDYQEIYWKPSN